MTANAMKTSVKKCIRAASNLIVRTQSHSICQTLGNFSGVEFLRTVSKFRKKEGDCFVFMSSIKCEIRPFHVIDIVVQRQQRNVEKSVMHVQSCCFANLKGHSQLQDCADLDTTFASLKIVYLSLKSNLCVGYI